MTKSRMTERNHTTRPERPPPRKNPLELYHIIIHCRDEAQQRELFDRLRREGLRCRLTVL